MHTTRPSGRPDIEALLKDKPKFHRLSDIHAELSGELTSWGARMEVLLAMQDFLKPGMNSLETGCGQSTVMFAASGANHWCITPAQGEIDRLIGYCLEHDLDIERVRFIRGNSQDELPRLDPSLRFHLVFIDGGHFFPIPCFDWYYADKHLLPGGALVLDDVRIPTVRIVHDFLCADKNWRLVRLVGDTAYFRKLKHSENLNDWLDQQYNSSYPDWSFLPAPARARKTLQHALRLIDQKIVSRIKYHTNRLLRWQR